MTPLLDQRRNNRAPIISLPTTLDRLPPHSIEAEQGVLGCMLLEPGKLNEARKRLGKSEAFYDLRHRTIYEMLCDMADERQAIDLITVQQRLKDNRQLEAVGGLPYLASLPDATPSAVNLDYYLEILRDKYAQRRLIQIATEVIGRTYEGDSETFWNTLEAVEKDFASVKEIAAPRLDLPEIEVVSEVEDREPEPEPEEVIHGVAHRGDKLATGGGSKSMKTWTLADMAISVANGVKWLDFPTTKGRVLFLNFEIRSVFFYQRLRTIARAKGVGLENLDVWNLRGYATDAGIILPKIEKRIEQVPYSLIITDPIYKLYGASLDENKAGDVARLLNHLEHLAVASDALVAFSAHFSKGNQSSKDSIDRISGSGVFARDPDSLVMFTPHKDKDCFTVEPTLRNFKPVEPFAIRWDYPLMRLANDLDPADLRTAPGGRPKAHDPLKILKAIDNTTERNPVSTIDWAARADISRSTLSNYIPALREKGWISTTGEGTNARKYITPKGLKACE